MAMAREGVDMQRAIGRLAAMPAFLDAALARIPSALHARRPATGEWALVEQACHLRDLEREGFLERARRMLAETEPVLETFHGDVVARERDYLSQDAGRAAREFSAARRDLTRLLAGLGPAQLQRTGIFEGGRLALCMLATMVEEHDREHRGQIESLLSALERAVAGATPGA